MRKKVLITGPILTQSGYGVHARTIYRALKTREDIFDIYISPINWGNTSWQWEDDDERREIDQIIGKTQAYRNADGNFDLNLMVTIPPEWAQYRLGAENIGITAGIESSRVAANWITAGNNFVEKIIVPSSFSKKTYEDTIYAVESPESEDYKKVELSTPIEVINYPVKKYNKVDLAIDLEYDFNFLVVVQWSIRKNLENTIRWFVEEFIDQEVGLVIKTNIVSNSIMDKYHTEKRLHGLLAQYPERKCKVYLLHGYLNNDEVHSLYLHPKIKTLLSLTHGEGYGLPIFEAAYCGLPVVSHDWGGQMDFLYMPNKEKQKAFFTKVDYDLNNIQPEAVWEGVLEKDSMWAFPKQGSSKMKMRKAYKEHSRLKSRAKKLQKYLLKEFSEKKIYEKVVSSLVSEEEYDVEAWLTSLEIEEHD